MDLLHHGNWRVVGRLVVEDGPSLDVYECPVCFALTREPLDHSDHHLLHRTAHPRHWRNT